MQRQYLCINTVKNIDEAERTVKQLGMEIIFRCKDAIIKPEDLSKEEWSSWLDSLEAQLSRNLELGTIISKGLADLAQTGKRHASEIESLIKRYRANPSKELYDSMLMENMLHDSKFKMLRDCTSTSSLYSMVEAIAYPSVTRLVPIYVSCLVAAKGENVIRCLSFTKSGNPIITIVGRDAEGIKAQMEAISKLDANQTLSS